MDEPSLNGDGGGSRDSLGRFLKGHRGGPGNPFNKRTQEFRAAIMEAATKDDLADVIRAMFTKAKAGDVGAANFIFDRLIGRASPVDVLERLEKLEESLLGGN
jgi:hypothetical protein